MLIQRKCLGTVAFIAVDNNPVPFTKSMMELVSFNNEFVCDPGEWIHYDCGLKSGQSLQRNMLARRMLGDWIFFVDADHDFAPDLLYRLLRVFMGRNPTGQPIDVLGGYYAFKEYPHQPMVWMYHKEKQIYGQATNWHFDAVCSCGLLLKDQEVLAKHQTQCRHHQTTPQIRHTPMSPVGVIGGGCMLISRRAIMTVLEKTQGEPFDPIGIFLYDDFSFCERCRIAGVPVWWAPKIECPHLLTRAITSEDYDRDFVMSQRAQAEAMA